MTYPGNTPITGPFEAAKLTGCERWDVLTNGGRRWLVETPHQGVARWLAERLTTAERMRAHQERHTGYLEAAAECAAVALAYVEEAEAHPDSDLLVTLEAELFAKARAYRGALATPHSEARDG